MATTSKITLGDGSSVEMKRNEGVPDAIWEDVVKFVKENQKAVKKNPAIVKLLSQHPEQVPMLMNFTNDADSIKNFLQSQVLAANVSEDGQQEKMKALQEDPAFKPMFDDIKQNGPDVIMKYLGDEALMRKLSQKLGGITPEIMKQLTAINETSVPSASMSNEPHSKSGAEAHRGAPHGRKATMFATNATTWKPYSAKYFTTEPRCCQMCMSVSE